MKKKGQTMLYHEFEPIFTRDSRILILGSFPSVKSRENNFYYGHPSNRFWKLMALILREEEPETIEEKKDLLVRNKIALYDAVELAEIEGSLDSNLRVVEPANLRPILEGSRIEKIFCNGTKSYEVVKSSGLDAIKLPSTSSANARYSMDDLYKEWKVILKYLEK